MPDESEPEQPARKTGPFGLSRRTHAIIFAVSVAIEVTLIAIFGVSLWQGAQWAWNWFGIG